MFYTPLPEKKLNLKIDQKVQKSLHQSPPVDFTTTAPPGRPPILSSVSHIRSLLIQSTLTSILSGAPAITHSLSEPLHFGLPPFRSPSTGTTHIQFTHQSQLIAPSERRSLSFAYYRSLGVHSVYWGGGITNNK